MAIANKALINKLWDNELVLSPIGAPLNFNDVAPKDKTQVFVLSPEVALAAEKLLRSPTFTIPDTSGWHIPYSHVAIEYPITEEIATLYRVKDEGTERITLIGAHIHEIQEYHGFVFTPYWQYKNGAMQFSLFSFIVGGPDTLAEWLPPIKLNTRPSTDGDITVYVLPSSATIKALDSLGAAPEILSKMLKDERCIIHMRESAVEIPIILFACNMLLTCKSGITRTNIPERKPKMSGLGARMRKKLSASAYTVLHLSDTEVVDMDGTIKSKINVAAHYVRGHFKQRKKGLYWWNPFIRGTGELRKREAYSVKQ